MQRLGLSTLFSTRSSSAFIGNVSLLSLLPFRLWSREVTGSRKLSRICTHTSVYRDVSKPMHRHRHEATHIALRQIVVVSVVMLLAPGNSCPHRANSTIGLVSH
jgi:hypothetical protein